MKSINLSWLKTDAKTWMWRLLPVATILAFWIPGQIKSASPWGFVWLDLSLVLGWILGWLLAEADHVMYATMCNPQELTCQRVKAEIDKKDWRRAWGLLEETGGRERSYQ